MASNELGIPESPQSPRGVTLDDLQVSPSAESDDVDFISDDDDEGSDFMKNLCKEADYAHEQLSAEYQELGGVVNVLAAKKRASLKWLDRVRLNKEKKSTAAGSVAPANNAPGQKSGDRFPSDDSTDPYSSGVDEVVFDGALDEHNQGYAEYVKNKELESALSPDEKSVREAVIQEEAEEAIAQYIEKQSSHNLYENFNGTPAAPQELVSQTGGKFVGGKGTHNEVASQSNLDRVERISEMSKRKKREQNDKSRTEDSLNLWSMCCGGRG